MYRGPHTAPLKRKMSIDILLRWSKEVSISRVAFVALNRSEIPRISHVELTFAKIVQTLAKFRRNRSK